jgi:beta-mannosidase
MPRTVELDGSWHLRGWLGLDPALAAAARGDLAGRPGWLPALVPGSVLDDLWHAGELPNPYVERSSLAAEWVPQRTWVYRRQVAAGPLADGERAWLRFDGIDHAGQAFLDGRPLGRHEGMFVPWELEVSDALADGREHELAVVVEPAPPSEPQEGKTSRVRVHKSRMTYGWDFCPRMIHQGLWGSVALEITGGTRILDVWARPRLAPDLRRAVVEVRVTLDLLAPVPLRLEADLAGPSPAVAAEAVDAPAGRSEVILALDVPDPVLWWPNGHGEPVVHRLTVRACGPDGLLDERSVPVGLRRLELVPNEGAPPDARPYTWVVNGRRVYARGWNWVPLDALYGVPRPERLAHLIRLAAAARVNLLRVWGGGLVETRAFYDACDRAGIMVWQEFSQSSSGAESVPATDPAFVDRMTREAEAIVPLRRNHPSLVAWCGGNELADGAGPLDERSAVLAGLREVVERLDPDRAWFPSSPSGRQFLNRLDAIAADPDGLHDVHGPWEHQGLRDHTTLCDRGTSLLHSEFGVEGMTNRRVHEALIRPEHRWPASRENPVYRHLGDWWNNERLVQASFGGRLADLETLRRASQHLQADGLRYAVEANRRRAWRQSGSLPWQLNESYPNAWCTSAVDHHGDPKPAYFGVRRSYAAVVVCASFDGWAWGGRGPFEARVWAWADARRIDGGRAGARLLSVDGDVLAEADFPVHLADGWPAELGRIVGPAGPLPPVLLLDLAVDDPEGHRLAANRYLVSGAEDLAPLLDLATASVAVDVAVEADRWRIALRHVGGPAAVGLLVEDDRPIEAPGWAEPSDGWFDMLPGESRELVVDWPSAPARGRRLRLSGWNVAAVALEDQ